MKYVSFVTVIGAWQLIGISKNNLEHELCSPKT